MQPIVTDRAYEFVPPYRGNLWPWLLKFLIPGYLRKLYGVTDIEFRGTDRLRDVFRHLWYRRLLHSWQQRRCRNHFSQRLLCAQRDLVLQRHADRRIDLRRRLRDGHHVSLELKRTSPR